MSVNVIQLHNTTPEEFKNEIKSVIDNALEKFKLENNSADPEKILTREETAKLLSISLVTLWSWTKKDIIRAYRIGNQVRYIYKDVIDALQKINGNVQSTNHL